MNNFNKSVQGREIKKESNKTIIILSVIMIVFMAYDIFGSSVMSLFQDDEYFINIFDGPVFNESYSSLVSENHYSISHTVKIKSLKEQSRFTFLLLNEGVNLLDDYVLKILVVDPLGRIRGEKQLDLGKEDKKLKIFFNFPGQNEVLEDGWKIYSKIIKNEDIYSVNFYSFNQGEDEVSFTTYIIVVASILFGIASLLIPLLIRRFRK